MDNRLYEIYTDDSGSFTVGSIAARNKDDIVFIGISSWYLANQRVADIISARNPMKKHIC